MVTQESLNKMVGEFCQSVSREISIAAVYLFGSYAHGNSTDSSDIDLAVVSDDFLGIRFDDNKRLHKFSLRISPYIETHPFKTEDFTSDNPLVEEILRTGRKVL